jgi:hypothetical protein
MDQDIHFQQTAAFVSGSTPSTFFRIPYRCTLRDVQGTINSTAGADEETVTVAGGGTVASGAAGATTDLGVLTFASGVGAGGAGTWVEDTTDGGMTLLAGSILKTTVTDGTSTNINLDIELDPYAR